MNIKLARPLLLASCFVTVASTTVVNAAPYNQNIPGPTGQEQEGGFNHVGMSRNGRYAVIADSTRKFDASAPATYIRDFAKQTTTKISNDGGDSQFYAISPNGRYVSYWSNPRNGRFVLDRALQIERPLTGAVSGSQNIGLSDNGFALFNQTSATTAKPLALYNLTTFTQQLIYPDGADLGHMYQRNPLSADGRVALFKTTGIYRIYSADTGLTNTFTPSWNAQQLTVNDATLASSGKFLAFVSQLTGHKNFIYRAALSKNSDHTLTRYDITPFKVSINQDAIASGLSMSGDGRYVTFNGYLEEGHPEYAAAQAVGSPGYVRIFRLDTRLNKLVTVTTGFNGGPIIGPSGTPLINATSVISDDGSMVEYATNARNVTAIPPVSLGGERNFHAYFNDGFARNYQFIDMPNTQNAWTQYNPMKLVGDHQWEGYVTVSAGSDAFSFSAGGKLVNGVFDSSTTVIGAGNSLGQAAINGSIISPTSFSPQFSGTWRILFNDQTLKYHYSKADWKRTVIFIQGQTIDGQDMFVRGGIDHTYALNTLGLNCNDSNYLCSIPIRYRNTLNNYTANWKVNDTYLDWHGNETGQTLLNGVNAARGIAQGSVMDWTTNNTANINKVAINGVGYTPLNTWGDHYWMLDVDMDCGKTVNGWFEVKSFISNGPAWEPDISQVGAPYASGNHFAQCGKLNKFQRGNNSAVILPLP